MNSGIQSLNLRVWALRLSFNPSDFQRNKTHNELDLKPSREGEGKWHLTKGIYAPPPPRWSKNEQCTIVCRSQALQSPTTRFRARCHPLYQNSCVLVYCGWHLFFFYNFAVSCRERCTITNSFSSFYHINRCIKLSTKFGVKAPTLYEQFPTCETPARSHVFARREHILLRLVLGFSIQQFEKWRLPSSPRLIFSVPLTMAVGLDGSPNESHCHFFWVH